MVPAQGPGLAAAHASPPVHAFDFIPCPFGSPGLEDAPCGSPREAAGPADAPPPNPPFVFPARHSSPSLGPTTSARTDRRRPMSAIEPHDAPGASSLHGGDGLRTSVALPAFSFNPGAALPPAPEVVSLLSPPTTPSSARSLGSPSRLAGHGHRRGGSEFVGGSIRDGNSIAVMSSSPTRSESGVASPGLAPPPRRGHRRGVSGTISTSDLPTLHALPDFTMPRGGSAPNSPTAFDPREGNPIPLHDQPPSLPEPAHALHTRPLPGPAAREPPSRRLTVATPTLDVDGNASLPQIRLGRTRVGFSDKLEFIPRPLSLVSNETSSTATARPGHSVSGSISSLVSATASPTGRESPAAVARSPTRELTDYRPSTAGAILEHVVDLDQAAVPSAYPKRRNSIPTLLNIADSRAPTSSVDAAASSARTPKRWSFFGLEPHFKSSAAAPTKRRPSSTSSAESVSKAVVSGASSSEHDESDYVEADMDGVLAAGIGKKSKKKRVKGWAGSILPLKPRTHKKRSKMSEVRPPTPPASVGPFEDDDDDDDDDEADGNLDSGLPTPQVTINGSPDIDQMVSSSQRLQLREDASIPMIDLDAALGPFNTPLAYDAEWEAAQRAAGNMSKRRLHSAQGMKGFSGPGMHYHRRAESAPDLPPFDSGRSGILRFGSNSTMADVFEEDEEDVYESTASVRHRLALLNNTAVTDSDSEDGETTPPATVTSGQFGSAVGGPPPSSDAGRAPRRTCSGPDESETIMARSVRTEDSKASLQDDIIAEEPSSVVFPSANLFQDGLDSASSSPKKLPGGRDLAPVEVGPSHHANATALPISPYSASYASTHPSPRSPISMDAQRISTAPSSVTDEKSFQSLLMGEPGPEVRISVDYDMPSLTSGNSAMTRDSVLSPNPRLSQPSLREQRPVSVSSAAFGRRRSSLVSLSRLISSSHGERSKLSMEVTLDGEPEGKRSRSKGSKTKQRLGRMMQFWKPTNSKDGALS